MGYQTRGGCLIFGGLSAGELYVERVEELVQEILEKRLTEYVPPE